MKKLPVLKEFEWSKIGSYSDYKFSITCRKEEPKGGPFCIAFCYPKYGEPFVLKGGSPAIRHWLKQEYKKPVLVHKRLYNKVGFTFYEVYNLESSVHIYRGRRKRFSVYYLNRNSYKFHEFSVRRMPRKWMKELNDIPEKHPNI